MTGYVHLYLGANMSRRSSRSWASLERGKGTMRRQKKSVRLPRRRQCQESYFKYRFFSTGDYHVPECTLCLLLCWLYYFIWSDLSPTPWRPARGNICRLCSLDIFIWTAQQSIWHGKPVNISMDLTDLQCNDTLKEKYYSVGASVSKLHPRREA